MTATEATLIAALVGSPLLLSAFEYFSDRLRAQLRYSGWHAVFLDNGQVYFGKVDSINKSEVSIKEIYYLKGVDDSKIAKGELPVDYNLVKLGNEVHGPRDAMIINRAHILFTESLTDQGKVLEAIGDYEREQRIKDVIL